MTPVEEIKAKLDIVDFLRGYLDLKPAGRNWKANCPFHREKTPSFTVSQDKGIWHCFGCSEGGDIFKFVMKFENLEFYEALQSLAEKAGVELRKDSPEDYHNFGIIYEINREAANFFKQSLLNSDIAKDYLKNRGLKLETINEFEIGFAPHSWEDCKNYLLKFGFSSYDLIRAGVCVKTESGKIIDRFRGRIVFPLFNNLGKINGFSARILPQYEDDKTAKYLNSPETPIFSKSHLLFGWHKAKQSVRQEGRAFLVEGQMDVVMAHQDGIKYAIGTSGVALTNDQLQTIKINADKLILGFDSDVAGKDATERSIDLAYSKGFEVRTIFFSELGHEFHNIKDVADLVRHHPHKLKSLLLEPEQAMNFLFRTYPVSTINLEEQKKNARRLERTIALMPSVIDRNYWLKYLDNLLSISRNNASSISRASTASLKKGSVKEKSKVDLIAGRLVAFVLSFDDYRQIVNNVAKYLPEPYLRLYNGSTAGLEDLLSDIKQSLKDHPPAEDIEEEIRKLMLSLELEYLLNERFLLSRNLDFNNDEATQKYQTLTNRIEVIKKSI